MKKKEKDGRKKRLSEGAATGAVALIFLIIGFQAAVFVMKVVQRPAAPEEMITSESTASNTDGNATAEPAPSGAREARTFSSERSGTPEAQRSRTSEARRGDSGEAGLSREGLSVPPVGAPSRAGRGGRADSRQTAAQPEKSRLGGYKTPKRPGTTAAVVESRKPRRMESFPFNPNTVTHEELVRLGLSERQAEVIENYREKGGKFRSKEDFARMYVVSDSLFERLAPFIDIPKLELNAADSSALVELHGIGPYYARKILSYRDSLGGFYAPEQLMEIRGIDSARYAGLAGSICVDSSRIHPLRIWDLPEDSLALHPYLRKNTARSIVRYRRVYAMEPLRSEHYTLDALVEENILSNERAAKLRPYCREL